MIDFVAMQLSALKNTVGRTLRFVRETVVKLCFTLDPLR